MKRTRKPSAPGPSTGGSAKHAQPHELVNASWVQNAAALEPWAAVFGAVDMNTLSEGLKAATSRVTVDGNMREPEAMLYGQAVALQTIFTNLSRRAALNAGEYIDASERYLRLALRAQAQCRSTIEALHEMKHPRPLAFVRQANIAGGPQQVVNGTLPDSRAWETQSVQSKQLEASDGEWLELGAQGAAVPANPALATVGEVNGADERRR